MKINEYSEKQGVYKQQSICTKWIEEKHVQVFNTKETNQQELF